MIDDLVSTGVTEPYRMFTSRAEFRLSLRADNADLRLVEIGAAVGLLDPTATRSKQAMVDQGLKALEQYELTPNAWLSKGIKLKQDGVRRTAAAVLQLQEFDVTTVMRAVPELEPVSKLPAVVQDQIQTICRYKQYLDRQEKQVEQLRVDESLELPEGLPYDTMGSISNEERYILQHAQPATLAAANKIPGIRPSTLFFLLQYVKKTAKVTTQH